MEVAAASMAAGLCCVGACALALYLYHVLWVAPERVRAALRGQGVGGPRPSFPYGNRHEMRQLMSDAAAASLRGGGGGGIVHDYRSALFPHYERWRNEYGPIFTYSIGNMVFLHASRADVVRDLGLCVSPSDLGKSSYMKVTHRPLFGDGILKSSGEAWAYQRRLIAPEFFPDKVRGMVDLMVASATALVAAWEDRMISDDNRGGGGLELKIDDDIRAYSADVISRTCFGSSYVKGKEIFALIRELQKTVSSKQPNLVAEMTGLSLRTNRAAWRLNRQVRSLILGVARESGDGDRNLLNAMLRSAASSGGGAVAAEDLIVDNCKNIYFAGYETTAVTAAWCMMLLALHPEWQARGRDEGGRGGGAGPASPGWGAMRIRKRTPARAADPGPAPALAASPPRPPPPLLQQLPEEGSREEEEEVEEKRVILVAGVRVQEGDGGRVPAAASDGSSAMDDDVPKPEPQPQDAGARCSRNDGKRWRCKGAAVPGYLFCDRHIAWSTRKRKRRPKKHKQQLLQQHRGGGVLLPQAAKDEAAASAEEDAPQMVVRGGDDDGFFGGFRKRARGGGPGPAA